jgi:hypothetical protein
MHSKAPSHSLFPAQILTGASPDPTHLEQHGIRHANRQVSEHGEQPVGLYTLESQVMGDLVYREEEVLVGRPADHVCRQDEDGRQRVGVS